MGILYSLRWVLIKIYDFGVICWFSFWERALIPVYFNGECFNLKEVTNLTLKGKFWGLGSELSYTHECNLTTGEWTRWFKIVHFLFLIEEYSYTLVYKVIVH